MDYIPSFLPGDFLFISMNIMLESIPLGQAHIHLELLLEKNSVRTSPLIFPAAFPYFTPFRVVQALTIGASSCSPYQHIRDPLK